VFPRKTSYTPEGDNVFFDVPPALAMDENISEAMVSCVFSWDKPRAEWLAEQWGQIMRTSLGGPAYDDPGGDFLPGAFLRDGYVLTSRGCPHKCGFCVVPRREGGIRPLPIQAGSRVLDSNLFACPRDHVESVFRMLHKQNGKVGLHGGIDTKIAKPWHFELIGGLRRKLDRIYVAYDTPVQFQATTECIRQLRTTAGLSIGQVRCFVLCGYSEGDTPAIAEKRCVSILRAGAVPFASYYRSPDDMAGKRPTEWNDFVARWAWMPGVFARLKREDPELYSAAKETKGSTNGPTQR